MSSGTLEARHYKDCNLNIQNPANNIDEFDPHPIFNHMEDGLLLWNADVALGMNG
jgi:hypothetical protein